MQCFTCPRRVATIPQVLAILAHVSPLATPAIIVDTFLPGESRKTKMPRSLSRNLRGNSKSLSRSRVSVQGNRRNRGNLRGNCRSVTRSRSRIRT